GTDPTPARLPTLARRQRPLVVRGTRKSTPTARTSLGSLWAAIGLGQKIQGTTGVALLLSKCWHAGASLAGARRNSEVGGRRQTETGFITLCLDRAVQHDGKQAVSLSSASGA